MTAVPTPPDIDAIAAEAVAALDGEHRPVTPFSSRFEGFDLDAAYRAAAAVRSIRERRGERVVGRKIGFTNRTIWAEYGVWAPIWGPVYAGTVGELPPPQAAFRLGVLAEPRIEPEIVFGLGAAPDRSMDERELLGCIDWLAHGFEIVQSIFPGWRFAAADTVAGFGLHGALMVGPRHAVAPQRERWLADLSTFRIAIDRDGETVDHGAAENVLGGPLSALRHLVGLLDGSAALPRLAGGEIVTTGTLTRAFPVAPGQRWRTTMSGIALEGIEVRFD